MSASSAPVGEFDLHAFVDGALASERAADVTAHLAGTPSDAEKVEAWRRQNRALKALFDPILEEPIPERLLTVQPVRRPAWLMQAAAAAILVLLGGAIGWTIRDFGLESTNRGGVLARAAADAHRLYVAEIRHPVEVTAKEEKHLIAWLSKRLGVPVRAPALTEAGFNLMGGRLLPADGRPAAQFMYENAEGRRLTLFVRGNGDSGSTAFRFVADGPAQGFYWVDGPLGYALMGDVGRERLLEISRLVYRQLNP